MKQPTHYTLLGISPKASIDDIKKAYRQKIRQVHPDTGATDSELLRQLNLAYETLKDPARRTVYDRQLQGEAWRNLGKKGYAFGRSIKDNLTVLKETLSTKPQKNFDEYLSVYVYFWQAALGDKVAVQTTHHRILVPMPAFDDSLSLKIVGAGLRRPDGSFGDLYLTFNIKNPSIATLNDEQKQAY